MIVLCSAAGARSNVGRVYQNPGEWIKRKRSVLGVIIVKNCTDCIQSKRQDTTIG